MSLTNSIEEAGLLLFFLLVLLYVLYTVYIFHMHSDDNVEFQNETCGRGCSALLFGITCLFLVASILGTARKTQRELDYKCLIWPDWAWWLTIINAFIWIAVCVLLRRGMASCKSLW
jgi:cytochrome bd-type quinol oxidase subunit 2